MMRTLGAVEAPGRVPGRPSADTCPRWRLQQRPSLAVGCGLLEGDRSALTHEQTADDHSKC